MKETIKIRIPVTRCLKPMKMDDGTIQCTPIDLPGKVSMTDIAKKGMLIGEGYKWAVVEIPTSALEAVLAEYPVDYSEPRKHKANTEMEDAE